MGGEIAHFASPGMQFPSSIHISLKSYLKHINFIFLGWMGLRGSPPDMAR